MDADLEVAHTLPSGYIVKISERDTQIRDDKTKRHLDKLMEHYSSLVVDLRAGKISAKVTKEESDKLPKTDTQICPVGVN